MVSVVLSTYNDERYIGETIASVLCQTFGDFEFIIWNDGSTDGTEAVILSYDDPRIRYFRHENTGIGLARKMATAEARGKYIAPVDGDDVFMPTRIAEEVQFLETHPDYVLVCSQCEYVDEAGKHIGESFSVTTDRLIRGRFPSDVITHSTAMFRKSAYEAAGGYAGVRVGLDHLLFMRMTRQGKMRMLNKELVKYRMRGNSLCHAYNPYVTVLAQYRVKMGQDKDVLPEDVALYNEIYMRNKTITPPPLSASVPTAALPRRMGNIIEKRLYDGLRLITGKRTARGIVISIKNLLFYITGKIPIP